GLDLLQSLHAAQSSDHLVTGPQFSQAIVQHNQDFFIVINYQIAFHIPSPARRPAWHRASSLIIPYSTLGDNCSPFQQVVQFDFRLLILDAWRGFRILPQIPLNRRVRQHLTIGFFYLLLALLLTWPTVSHLTS